MEKGWREGVASGSRNVNLGEGWFWNENEFKLNF